MATMAGEGLTGVAISGQGRGLTGVVISGPNCLPIAFSRPRFAGRDISICVCQCINLCVYQSACISTCAGHVLLQQCHELPRSCTAR